MLFSKSGFTKELKSEAAKKGNVELVGLNGLFEPTRPDVDGVWKASLLKF